MIDELQGKKLKGFGNLIFSLLISLFLMSIHPSLSGAAEKNYPDRPIKMIIPGGAGGSSDLASRMLADRMAEFLGQPLISEYKPGASGSLGAAFVAKAKPDGYTVVVGGPYNLVAMPIVRKLTYKPDDFTHAGIFGKVPFWLPVKADSRWKTLKEFIEEGKKSPGKLTVASYGRLSTAHFLIELLNKHAGVALKHIPYASISEAFTALLGGHVDAAMVAGTGGLLESGSVRILAVAEGQRLEDLPDIPTFMEFGYPIVFRGWYSLSFPKGTPEEIVEKFSKAIEKVFMRYPKEIKADLRKVEVWAEYINSENSVKLIQRDYDLFFKIAEELGAVAK